MTEASYSLILVQQEIIREQQKRLEKAETTIEEFTRAIIFDVPCCNCKKSIVSQPGSIRFACQDCQSEYCVECKDQFLRIVCDQNDLCCFNCWDIVQEEGCLVCQQLSNQ